MTPFVGPKGLIMAINLMCTKCKKTHKRSTLRCSCGTTLKNNSKYRIRVKTSEGWQSKTTLTLSDAKKVEQELLLNLPSLQEIQTPTIQDIWPMYESWAKINKKSWEADRSRYSHHLKDYLGPLKMDSIKPNVIQKILNQMHGSFAPSTIKQVLVLLKRLYSWSEEQGLYAGDNPTLRIKPPKFDNKVTNTLSKDDMKSLMDTLDKWKNERAVLIVKFALYSGKRRGEILGLRWSDVDLEGGLLTLQETKSGKTQTLPLNNKCLMILKRALEIKICDYVFPTTTGQFYHGFSNTWVKIRRRAGLPDFRFHDLRHTYASYLASSGKVDIYTLKELLGHSTIEMTQRYAHLVNGALRKAACVADEVF